MVRAAALVFLAFQAVDLDSADAVTNVRDANHVEAVARLCLAAEKSRDNVATLRAYARGHRLTKAEYSDLLDRCSIAMEHEILDKGRK